MMASEMGEVDSVELWEDCATVHISAKGLSTLDVDVPREGAEEWLGKSVIVTVFVEEAD